MIYKECVSANAHKILFIWLELSEFVQIDVQQIIMQILLIEFAWLEDLAQHHPFFIILKIQIICVSKIVQEVHMLIHQQVDAYFIALIHILLIQQLKNVFKYVLQIISEIMLHELVY